MFGRAEIRAPEAIPVTANGVFEVLTAPHDQWDLDLRNFHESERQIATIHSLCPPVILPISNDIVMSMTCSKGDQKAFEGYDLKGSLLWQIPIPPDQHYPRLISIPNSPRFAIESLRLKHPGAVPYHLTGEDVAGEDIDIYDTLTGIRVATFQPSPAYTGGRNVDFSPDGQRMAVLNDGAIEVYSLGDLIKAFPTTSH
jgi:hypothetical protein